MSERLVGPWCVRLMRGRERGEVLAAPHTHAFGHLTMVCEGWARVNDQTLGPGEAVHVPAEIEHTVTALTPGALVACIFIARDVEGDPAAEWNGNVESFT